MEALELATMAEEEVIEIDLAQLKKMKVSRGSSQIATLQLVRECKATACAGPRAEEAGDGTGAGNERDQGRAAGQGREISQRARCRKCVHANVRILSCGVGYCAEEDLLEEEEVEEEEEEEEDLEEGEEEEGGEEGKEGVGNVGEQPQAQSEQKPSTRDQPHATESETATATSVL